MSWNKRINSKIEKEMIKMYKNGYSSLKIAEKFGYKSHKTVLDVLTKNNIEKRSTARQTNYNTSFFRKVNSHDVAYIFGFLCADGYILKDYVGIALQLQYKDYHILKSIKQRLGESCSIIKIDHSKRRSKGVNSQDMHRLTVHNKEMSQDVKKFGIVKNKTKVLTIKKRIPKKYASSFVRGVFDGDGTIGVSSNGNIWCQFVTASEIFAIDVGELLSDFNYKIQKPSKNRTTFTLRISGGNVETIKFLRWMYKDKEDLYLRRKYEKLQSYLN